MNTFSGGNGNIFRPWLKVMEEAAIALWVVELPNRTNSANISKLNFPQVVESAVKIIEANLPANQKIIFFGHSLGGLLAFEVIRRLKKLKVDNVVLSAVRNPAWLTSFNSVPSNLKGGLSDKDLTSYFHAMSKSMSAVDPEIIKFMLPIMRADYQLFESYVYDDSLGIPSCNMTVFGALNDPQVTNPHENLRDWARFTSGRCEGEVFAQGDHMYFTESPSREMVLERVLAICAREEVAWTPPTQDTPTREPVAAPQYGTPTPEPLCETPHNVTPAGGRSNGLAELEGGQAGSQGDADEGSDVPTLLKAQNRLLREQNLRLEEQNGRLEAHGLLLREMMQRSEEQHKEQIAFLKSQLADLKALLERR